MPEQGGISLIGLELVLGFGAPLAWGFWELYALRRDKRRAEAQAQAQAQKSVQEQAARRGGDTAQPGA
jgi:hypothetical protein